MPGPDREPREFEAVYALRDALATRAHAEMLFAQVADLLGETAYVETVDGVASRTLFRREAPGSPWIVPWPVLSVARGGREGPSPLPTGVPGVYEEVPPRPGPAPKLRGLGPGSVTIHDGPESVTIAYGADGRWFETVVSDPRRTLAGALPALARRSASPVELVAAYVAGLDPARHGPGRVHLPVVLPQGVENVWRTGLFGIRQAFFEEQVPAPAAAERRSPAGRWAAADGWTGRAVAFGATREAALAAWRDEVARVRPFPERRPPTPAPEPEVADATAESNLEMEVEGAGFAFGGIFFARALQIDAPAVEPSPGNSPAALVPVPDLPDAPPPLGGWVRTIGARGAVRFAALRRERGGLTLVGDLALEQGVEDLDSRLDAADRAWDAERAAHPRPKFELPPGFPPPPPTDTQVRRYGLVHGQTGEPIPPACSSDGRSQGFDARTLDADRLRGEAVRMRRLPAER